MADETPVGAQGVYQTERPGQGRQDQHQGDAVDASSPAVIEKDRGPERSDDRLRSHGVERGLSTMQYPEDLKGIRLQQIDGTDDLPARGGGGLVGGGLEEPRAEGLRGSPRREERGREQVQVR